MRDATTKASHCARRRPCSGPGDRPDIIGLGLGWPISCGPVVSPNFFGAGLKRTLE
jgi:hypothetical protein